MRQQVLRLAEQLRDRGTTRRPIGTRAQSGFTLLEVMIAVSILAISLMGLSLSVSRSLRASQHARLMTQATFLVRQQLGDLENNFIVDGFTDDSGIKEDKGDFPDPAFKNFRWMRTVEKIRLPSQDQIQAAATKLIQDKQQIGSKAASSSGAAAPSAAGGLGGAGGSGMGGLLGPVKDMLEQGIRRVSVRVLWDEPGLPNQMVEVVTFYTDMRRIPVTP